MDALKFALVLTGSVLGLSIVAGVGVRLGFWIVERWLGH